MKYLKRFNEELSPELLGKVAGDRDTPQKKRIGAQADLRKKLQDPEYVKSEAQKKAAEEKRKAIASKYPIFTSEGMDIKICYVKLENGYGDAKNLEYDYINFSAEANIDNKQITLSIKSGEGPYLEAIFTENGIEFFDIRDFIFDDDNSYYVKDVLELIGDYDKNPQISFIGFERGNLNTLCSIIKELYPNSTVSATNFNIISDGESKKAGIWGKDFDEKGSVYCNTRNSWEMDELEDSFKNANKFAVPSIEL